jgi:hypothetical protein
MRQELTASTDEFLLCSAIIHLPKMTDVAGVP